MHSQCLGSWPWHLGMKYYWWSVSTGVPGREAARALLLAQMPFSFLIKADIPCVFDRPQTSYFSSVQSLSRVTLCEPIHQARLPCPTPTPRACSNSCPLSWCHPTISSSVIPFSSSLQSFPAWGSFPMSQFFPSGGQSIGVSASASILPMNTQDWFPLGWTGWISLQSKGLSRVFSNTIVQKY